MIKKYSPYSKVGYCTQDKYDAMRQRRKRRIKHRRKYTKYTTEQKPGCQPLSRLHPDHPARREFEGRINAPKFEAGEAQEFAP